MSTVNPVAEKDPIRIKGLSLLFDTVKTGVEISKKLADTAVVGATALQGIAESLASIAESLVAISEAGGDSATAQEQQAASLEELTAMVARAEGLPAPNQTPNQTPKQTSKSAATATAKAALDDWGVVVESGRNSYGR
jgi:predicted metal-dependent TIM-barrel fold hydrolase